VSLSDYRQRAAQADLGHWTRTEFGPSAAMLGPVGVTQVAAYYSGGPFELFDLHGSDKLVENLMRHGSFDVVLVLDKPETPNGHADLLQHVADLGYAPIDDQPFSAKLRNVLVLARRTRLGRRGADL
jgi:hypothetical protein